MLIPFYKLRPGRTGLLALLGIMLIGCANLAPDQDRRSDTIIKLDASRDPLFQVQTGSAPIEPDAARLFQDALQAINDGQPDVAEDLLQTLTTRFPHYANPHINLGLIYRHANKPELAARSFKTAIEVDPENCSAHIQLGLLERSRFQFELAEQAYLGCLQIEPSNPVAHINIGILYELYMGRFHQALLAYERYQSMQAEPDRQVALWIADLSRRVNSRQLTADIRP